jgi:hypothetical protein
MIRAVANFRRPLASTMRQTDGIDAYASVPQTDGWVREEKF